MLQGSGLDPFVTESYQESIVPRCRSTGIATHCTAPHQGWEGRSGSQPRPTGISLLAPSGQSSDAPSDAARHVVPVQRRSRPSEVVFRPNRSRLMTPPVGPSMSVRVGRAPQGRSGALTRAPRTAPRGKMSAPRPATPRPGAPRPRSRRPGHSAAGPGAGPRPWLAGFSPARLARLSG